MHTDNESRFANIEIDDDSAPSTAKAFGSDAAETLIVDFLGFLLHLCALPRPASRLSYALCDAAVGGVEFLLQLCALPRPVAAALLPATQGPSAATIPGVPTAAGWPFGNPATFPATTSHGVAMNHRMRRCYGSLRAMNIGISDFSTDTAVASNLDKLSSFLRLIQDAGAAVPEGTLRAQLRDLYVDVRGLMNRVPANRSQGVTRNGAPVLAGAPTSAPATQKAQKEIVAVKHADDSTGAVVYWQLSGDVDVASLRAAWQAEGLDEAMLLNPASPDVALRRAVKELATRNILVRQDPKGGWTFVHEETKTGALAYRVGTRVFLVDGQITVEKGEGETDVDAHRSLSVIVAEYEEQRRKITTADASVWLVRLAGRLGAVALREAGGVYFVPRGEPVQTMAKVRKAFARCSSFVVYEIPAVRSTETLRAIVDSVTREARTFIADLETEINAGDMGARKATNRVADVDAMVAKLRQYGTLVAATAPLAADVEKKLGELKAKLVTMTSRTSQLEIE